MQDKLFLNDKFIEQLRTYIRFKDWSDGREREVQFSVTFRREDFFIKDHVLGGKLLVPAVIFMELWARIAGSLLKEGSPVVLQNIIFVKPALVDKDRLEMNCVCTGSSNSIKFRVETCQGVHIQGKIVLDRATGTEDKNILPDDWKKRCNVKIESGDFYKHFEKTGYQYGPSFKNMQYVSMGESEALAFIKADGKTEEQQKEFMLYPGILEGGLQATGFFLEKDVKEYLSFVPFQVGQLQVFRKLPRECYVHIRKIDTKDGRSKKAELFFLTGNGEIAASIKDYYVMPLKKPNPPVSLIVKPEEKPVDIAIIGIS
jgi:hypothetical protein